MALQGLPLDVFLEILDYLRSKADEACLLLTCKGFHRLLPSRESILFTDYSFWFEVSFTFGHRFMEDYCQKEDKIELTYRLLRPGNLLSHLPGKSLVCVACAHAKPDDEFPLLDIRIEDRLVCRDCIVSLFKTAMPNGYKLSIGNEDVCKCASRASEGSPQEMHTHEGPGYKRWYAKGRICKDCHMSICWNVSCRGWPSGFVELNAEHFTSEHEPLQEDRFSFVF